MSTRILLVRHGETDWNTEEKIQGSNDIPLNAKGLEQASRLAQRLKAESIAAIYSSPQVRAEATARQVAQFHPQAVLTHIPELAEFGLGKLEGTKVADLRQIDWDLLNGSDEYRLSIGAEPKAPARQWIQDHLPQIFSRHRQQTILLSTHGAKKRFLLENLFPELQQMFVENHPRNCSLTIVRWHPQEGVSLELYNDTSHLDMLG